MRPREPGLHPGPPWHNSDSGSPSFSASARGPMRSRPALSIICVTALPLLAGCMRARIDESRELSTTIAADESVVVLAKPQIEGAGAEAEFLDCISRRLASGGAGLSVHSNEAFADKLFPWFEPGTVPTKAEGVAAVLAQPGVSEQVAATGVRYVVWLDGGTRKTDGGGSLACAAA